MVNNPYMFYDMMSYPLPFQKEFFAYEEIIDTIKQPSDLSLSRAKADPALEEYVAHIQKLARLWQGLPFVEAVYLCNAITFNKLHAESDIDLFFVTSEGRLWLVSGLAHIATRLLALGRWGKKQRRKKLCLNFFVTRDSLNLQSIKLSYTDPYLVYWLAHLVPIYMRSEELPLDIYEENYRLRSYLPGFPMEQVIHLGTQIVTGVSTMRKRSERLCAGFLGDLFEQIAKGIQLPLYLWKKQQAGSVGETMIVGNSMIKLYKDKRKHIAMQRKLLQR